MSIHVTLLCAVQTGQWQTLLVFLERNLPNVRRFAGNRQVKVLFDQTNDMMLLDEIWQSSEHHQAYLAAIEDSGVLAQLNEFLSCPPTIQYFQLWDI